MGTNKGAVGQFPGELASGVGDSLPSLPESGVVLDSSASDSVPTDTSYLLPSSLQSLPVQSLPMALESTDTVGDTSVGTIPPVAPWPISIDQPGDTEALPTLVSEAENDPTITVRRANGQFAPGNPGRPQGNPYARRASIARRQLMKTVGTKQFTKGIQKLMAQFAAGDHTAQKLVLSYILGPPEALDLVKEVAKLKTIILQQVTPNG